MSDTRKTPEVHESGEKKVMRFVDWLIGEHSTEVLLTTVLAVAAIGIFAANELLGDKSPFVNLLPEKTKESQNFTKHDLFDLGKIPTPNYTLPFVNMPINIPLNERTAEGTTRTGQNIIYKDNMIFCYYDNTSVDLSIFDDENGPVVRFTYSITAPGSFHTITYKGEYPIGPRGFIVVPVNPDELSTDKSSAVDELESTQWMVVGMLVNGQVVPVDVTIDN